MVNNSFSNSLCNKKRLCCENSPHAIKELILNTIADYFEQYGYYVFDHPWRFIIIPSIICCIFSVGFLYRIPERDMDILYTLPSSPSVTAKVELNKLFPLERISYIFAVSKDGTGLLSSSGLSTLNTLWLSIENLKIPKSLIKQAIRAGDQSVTHYLQDFHLNPKSNITTLLTHTMEQNQNNFIQLKHICIMDSLNRCKIDSPLFLYGSNMLWGKPIRLPKYPLYIDPRNQRILRADSVLSGLTIQTFSTGTSQIINATVAAFRIHLQGDAPITPYVKTWEQGLIGFITLFKNPTIELFVRTERSINDELALSSQLQGHDLMMLLLASLFVACFTIFINSSRLLYRTKSLSSAIGIVTTLLAYGGGVGFCHLIGIKHVPPAEATPFMVLGICVDDIFVITNSYSMTYLHHDNAKVRIGLCLRDAGISVTITTLTNILALTVGATSVYYSISVFCILTATALTVGYILCLTVFLGALTLDAQREQIQSIAMTQSLQDTTHVINKKSVVNCLNDEILFNDMMLSSTSTTSPSLKQTHSEPPYQLDSHNSLPSFNLDPTLINPIHTISPLLHKGPFCNNHSNIVHNTSLQPESLQYDLHQNIVSNKMFFFNNKHTQQLCQLPLDEHSTLQLTDPSFMITNTSNNKDDLPDTHTCLHQSTDTLEESSNKQVVFSSHTLFETNQTIPITPSGHTGQIKINKVVNLSHLCQPNTHNTHSSSIVNEGLYIVETLDSYWIASERVKLCGNNELQSNITINIKDLFPLDTKSQYDKSIPRHTLESSIKTRSFPLSLTLSSKECPNSLKSSFIQNKKTLSKNEIETSLIHLMRYYSLNPLLHTRMACNKIPSFYIDLDKLNVICLKGNEYVYKRNMIINEPNGSVGKQARQFIIHYYGPLLMTFWVKVLIMICFLLGLICSSININYLKTGLQLKDITPYDSYLRSFYLIRETYFTTYGDECVIVFPNQTSWWSHHIQDHINQLTNSLISTNHTILITNGLTDFLSYYKKNNNGLRVPETKHIFMTELTQWLMTFQGKQYKHMFTIKNNTLSSWKFHYWMKFIDNTSTSIIWLQEVQQLLNYLKPTIVGHVYTPLAIHWEGDIVIIQATIINMFAALVAMGIVAAILMSNLKSGILVLFTIIMIDVYVLGIMPLFGLRLNMLTMVNLVLSIGFAVDYTAHITHCFTHCKGNTREVRVIETLVLMGLPVTNGMISTYAAVVVLAFAKKYVLIVVFQMMTSVIIFAFLHGIVLMPVILSLIGPFKRHDIQLVYFSNGKIINKWLVHPQTGIIRRSKEISDVNRS